MHVIIEGADASGKSTIASLISWRYGLPVQQSEGPAKSQGEINSRTSRYLAARPMIFDRHPAVSQAIYDNKGIHITKELIAAFYKQPAIFIYCEPRIKLPHAGKAHDTPEHLAMIERRQEEILAAYRQWAATHAHIIYRVPEPPSMLFAVLDSIYRPTPTLSPFEDIKQFHTRFGLGYYGKPRPLPDDMQRLRDSRLTEEVNEYSAATTLPDKLDALVDLTYIALGTAYLHGFDFDEAWRRVHRANMTKMRAESAEHSRHGSAYDIVKPPDFVPPNLTDLC